VNSVVLIPLCISLHLIEKGILAPFKLTCPYSLVCFGIIGSSQQLRAGKKDYAGYNKQQHVFIGTVFRHYAAGEEEYI